MSDESPRPLKQTAATSLALDPAPSDETPSDGTGYMLRISRLTVDKLGVKLYDKASAVVSELIANSYDADAKQVTVTIPLGSILADSKTGADVGYEIVVEDDGHGMSPKEAQAQFLRVGRDRRETPEYATSRNIGRAVMGRKGIGKLAPFGICKQIEVWSAGGVQTSEGFEISHFIMNYADIVMDRDDPVQLVNGSEDRKFAPATGTKITLRNFQPKRVPSKSTFLRQLAARFILASPDFKILVKDSRQQEEDAEVGSLDVPVHDDTKIDVSQRPILTEDGKELIATGWLAMGKHSYQNEESAGVRIYARNKIVATTRDFEQPAGFTGEFTMRSYLVGEIHAEWLDADDGEDLVRSDRQGILWDSDYGRLLRDWGSNLIKEIARKSAAPRRESSKNDFLTQSRFIERAKAKYSQTKIQESAISLAEAFGSFAAKDELRDPEYLEGFAEMILSVAPHKALIDAFQRFSIQIDSGHVEITDIVDLFSTARIAELASYSQIADQRVRSIKELQKIVHGSDSDYDENDLQKLIAQAPWLIHPTWSVLSENQSLKSFASSFQKFYKTKTGDDVTIDVGDDLKNKRPDFTAVDLGRTLYIVEIKSSGHEFDDEDWERLSNYVGFFGEFFETNPSFQNEFPSGHKIILVTDGLKLKSGPLASLKQFKKAGVITQRTWNEFLLHAQKAHEQLLKASDAASNLLS